MPALKATIRPVNEVKGLEAAWRKLETLSDRSFFLSWDWAASAIELSGDHLLVAEITSSRDIVALGLLAPVTETRHGVVRARQLRLNETGLDAERSVFGEFNTLLAAPEIEALAWDALIEALNRPDAPGWDEIVITNALTNLETRLKEMGLRIHRRSEHGSAYVDLASLRARGVDTAAGYIATLGKSTRYQINRSMKLYRDRGPLTVDRAKTPSEGCAYLAEIGKLQKAKWRARGNFNEASSAHLFEFHCKLINRTLERGGVELACISAGGEPFAWVYNFIDRGCVLFNSGGFKLDSDNRLKPGLVAHALLIEAHLSAGMNVYDFLAGDDRYKLNLGQSGPEFVGFSIQRPTFTLRAESILRGLKHNLEGMVRVRRP
jgi:CelD/BcsL family acetyltransferase involved in cellulose biosynthesis